jgi:NTE family protein
MAGATRVALALGSGGARGYAHIGVIQELESQGFRIVGIAGTSMGALVGGLYAAGELDAYTEWVGALSYRDVLRLLDPALLGPGAVRGEKIVARVTELVGDTAIEDLPIPFTAVATDLTAHKEVWFQRGRLDAAIRASIAIPGLITPVVMHGRLLADGGLMNPVPVVATAAIPADITVAVTLNDEQETTGGWPAAPERSRAGTITEPDERPDDATVWSNLELMSILTSWLDNIRGMAAGEATQEAGGERAAAVVEPMFESLPVGLRTRDVLELALDTLRTVVARYRLAGYPPDVLISIPRDACGLMDFHRAEELIALGRERTRASLPASLTEPATDRGRLPNP